MPRTIAFVLFPGFQLLDAAGPMAAFEIAGRLAPGAYALRPFAAKAGAVRSSSGVSLEAARFVDRPRVHTLVVAGGHGTRGPIDPSLARFVRRASRAAVRTASVCSGAFILAELGLLDGKRATTHWSRSSDLARKFPSVRVEPERIFVRDGAVWTSAGITAGIDLALAMIAEDLGEDVAQKTARQLVVYYRRPGGQSQFSALLEIDRTQGAFGELLAWARERIGDDLGVERLAERAAMSPRNFARRFAGETGVTPARAIERIRVEVARERVEAGDEPLEKLASTCGFGDPERMRRAFVRAFGQPPQAFRRRRSTASRSRA